MNETKTGNDLKTAFEEGQEQNVAEALIGTLETHPDIIEIVNTIDVLSYLTETDPIKKKDGEFRDFSAEEIKNFALVFDVSVSDLSLEVPEPGDTALFSAVGRNNMIGIDCPAMIEQERGTLKKDQAGIELLRHWVERGVARVIRNARKHLIPTHLLKKRIVKAVEEKKKYDAKYEKVQGRIDAVWEKIKDEVAPMNRENLMALAEAHKYGPRAKWTVDTWIEFGKDLNDWSNTGYMASSVPVTETNGPKDWNRDEGTDSEAKPTNPPPDSEGSSEDASGSGDPEQMTLGE